MLPLCFPGKFSIWSDLKAHDARPLVALAAWRRWPRSAVPHPQSPRSSAWPVEGKIAEPLTACTGVRCQWGWRDLTGTRRFLLQVATIPAAWRYSLRSFAPDPCGLTAALAAFVFVARHKPRALARPRPTVRPVSILRMSGGRPIGPRTGRSRFHRRLWRWQRHRLRHGSTSLAAVRGGHSLRPHRPRLGKMHAIGGAQ
jgi:hypothetical protein